MTKETIVVLGGADEPQIEWLVKKLAGVKIVAGSSAEAFGAAAAEASVLLNWSGPLTLFRDVFGKCANLLWVHSRSVGLERTLFPELSESSVPLTNGSGVFSAALAEFTLGAILYFANAAETQEGARRIDFKTGPLVGANISTRNRERAEESCRLA